ncbi:MAG: glycosyltransferase family 2 protein [Salinivirgaceae bacterium]|nr:glycosyltransferase family 2 protein [Salinivirgaceae bacterium]
MSKPFFSIIIPAFNRAYILTQTIESVLLQTFNDFELIVVDDGSTDNTKEVVQNILDSRLTYIYQHNAERSVARNNGIRNSKGKYICFLDSDDWYENNHLQTLFDRIKTTNFPEALFFTHYYIFHHDNKSVPEIPLMNISPIKYMLKNPVIPARVCVHHTILEKFKFREDIVIVEDQVLWTTIAAHYPVFQIPEFTVVYHLHEDNSINIKKNCFRPRLEGMNLLFDQTDVGPLISKKEKNEIISNCYYGIAKHYAFKKDYLKMCLNVFLSLVSDVKSPQTKSKFYMLLYPSKSY